MNAHERLMQNRQWHHLGTAGEHRGHKLAADDMGVVWCQHCHRWLDDDEADTAWSVMGQYVNADGVSHDD